MIDQHPEKAERDRENLLTPTGCLNRIQVNEGE